MDGEMITSSPSFQFTGVDTAYWLLSCNASSTRTISSTLRPMAAEPLPLCFGDVV
jgi:hypothetical protein